MTTFPPGATVGLVGGGQLARMTALAARRLGYRLVVFAGEPAPSSDAGADERGRLPAEPVCERVVWGGFDDAAAREEFARRVDVVTLEWENVPADALRGWEARRPVRPGAAVLAVCQDRELEKQFFRRHGYPCAPFAPVRSAAELADAVRTLGLPCVLKRSVSGYDGKGQQTIRSADGLDGVWREWAAASAPGDGASPGEPAARGVVEAWVDFAAELSVICARTPRGEIRPFPVVENVHARHILELSLAPARFAPGVLREATALAVSLTERLEVVGLLAVEMFLTSRGELLVNELAPRPHNSGHLTFDAGLTSQFEQHARAVAGLPLGDPALLRAAVMVNLLGDLWIEEDSPETERRVAPDWTPVLAEPTAKLHLYGKRTARPGRKMGHFCVLDADLDAALAKARAIQDQLRRGGRAAEDG